MNGSYEPSRLSSNGLPIFENTHGFRMSFEALSNAGEAQKGWVIGKSAVGYFGTTATGDHGLPAAAWRCFPAAKGKTAPQVSEAKMVETPLGVQQGYQARLEKRNEEALDILQGCLQKFATGDIWTIAFILAAACSERRKRID